MKQFTFFSLSYDAKKKEPRRERFHLEMEQEVTWDACWPWLSRSIQPGRQPMPLNIQGA